MNGGMEMLKLVVVVEVVILLVTLRSHLHSSSHLSSSLSLSLSLQGFVFSFSLFKQPQQRVGCLVPQKPTKLRKKYFKSKKKKKKMRASAVSFSFLSLCSFSCVFGQIHK
jgi:hypothetical protein